MMLSSTWNASLQRTLQQKQRKHVKSAKTQNEHSIHLLHVRS